MCPVGVFYIIYIYIYRIQLRQRQQLLRSPHVAGFCFLNRLNGPEAACVLFLQPDCAEAASAEDLDAPPCCGSDGRVGRLGHVLAVAIAKLGVEFVEVKLAQA